MHLSPLRIGIGSYSLWYLVYNHGISGIGFGRDGEDKRARRRKIWVRLEVIWSFSRSIKIDMATTAFPLGSNRN